MSVGEHERQYVVNLNFDGGRAGEIITADPVLVRDWLAAGFISEVDDRGDRLVTFLGDGAQVPPVTPTHETVATARLEDGATEVSTSGEGASE